MVRRNFDLPQATHDHVNAEYLKGLINVVPVREAGDRAERFCVGRFAVEMYYKLLQGLQEVYPSLCRMMFVKMTDQACPIAGTPKWFMWFISVTVMFLVFAGPDESV